MKMKKILIATTVAAAGLGLLWLPAQAVTTYTAAQVSTHSTAADCWATVNGKVYNLTNYISAHPGGAAAITALCGHDGTSAFTGQHAGNSSALAALSSHYLGDLVTVTSDTTPPTVPTSLVATAAASSQINLAWHTSTDNVAVTGYTVYRNGVSVGTSATNSYTDTGLAASTTYSYTVAAYDAAHNASGQSTSASATTLGQGSDAVAPAIPTGLTVTSIGASQISLNWTDSTDNVGVAGYKVYRNGTIVGSPSASQYTDATLSASTIYTYSVAAFDAAGNTSGQSIALAVMTTAVSTSNATSTTCSLGRGDDDDDDDNRGERNRRGDNDDERSIRPLPVTASAVANFARHYGQKDENDEGDDD